MKLMTLILRVFSQKFGGSNVFVHIWFFETILIKNNNSIAVKKLIEHRKVCSEKFIFIALDTFLAQYFS